MKRHAPATARNREPILEILRGVLPATGTLLEIAAGTGEHAVFFAAAFPNLQWQPTDGSADSLPSIAAWCEGAENILPPIVLDASAPTWPLDRCDAILCINMIHISPFEATEGLMRGAGARLPSGAPLVTYGPYKIEGAHTAPSNASFDESLRARDPSWGVRDMAELETIAARSGLVLAERHAMPANNFTLVWRRQ